MALKYLRCWWNSRKNVMSWTSENDTNKPENTDSGTEESSSIDASSGTRSYSVLESVDIDTDVLFMSQSSSENLTSESSSCDSYITRQRGKGKYCVSSRATKIGTKNSEKQSDTEEDSSSSNSRNTNTTADDEQAMSSDIDEDSDRLQSLSRSHTDLVIPGWELPCVWQGSVESGVQSEMSHSSPSQSSGDGTSWELASQTSDEDELSDSLEELSDTSFITEILQPCENCRRRLKEATTSPTTPWEEKSRKFRTIGDPRLIRTRTCNRGSTDFCSSLATSSEFCTTESYTLSDSTSYCYTCSCDTCSYGESESDTCTMTWPPAKVRASPECLPDVRTPPGERIASWIEQNANLWEKKERKKSQTTSKAGRFLLKFCTIRRKNISDKYRTRRALVQSDVNSNKIGETDDVLSQEVLKNRDFHLCKQNENKFLTRTTYKGWKKLNRNYRPLIAYERTMFLESYGKDRLIEVGPVEPTTQNNRAHVRCESENKTCHGGSSVGFARVKTLGRPSEKVATLRCAHPHTRKLMIETTI
uniref:Uncharacterized protein n=1 Tax=Branchiostoma floridae TaxID=7739 RepID=C3ZD63_BRAFL|eukprot:XP_002593563.1 hypothetical protein BRAFLDRAFT_88502 [Branchiostoma floridae]